MDALVDVFLVSPNLVFPEDAISGRSSKVRSREWVVNVGLLSIATFLQGKGIRVRVLDLVGSPDHEAELLAEVSRLRPTLVGFSAVSCYSYPTIARYCRAIADVDPRVRLFGGGQHLSALPLTALAEIPELECVVVGEGEYAALDIVRAGLEHRDFSGIPNVVAKVGPSTVDGRSLPTPRVDLDEIPPLDYRLLDGFERYCPEIEWSRGCPYACNFCTDPYMFNRQVRYKSVRRFVAELQYVVDTYDRPADDIRAFFTCSTFGVQRKRVEELVARLRSDGPIVRWRTETRVDSCTVDYIDELAEVGMDVLDLGLETASPTMIRAMNKTSRPPEEYLRQAAEFFRRVGESPDVHLKVNLVFHAGESPQSLAETLEFLLGQRHYVASTSAGPVVMYPGTELARNFHSYAERFGSTIIPGAFWDQVHAYKVNPSAEMSFDTLNSVATMIAKMLTGERDYYRVKAYGQLPLQSTFDSWKESMIPAQDLHGFHFSAVNPSEWLTPSEAEIHNPLDALPDRGGCSTPRPQNVARRTDEDGSRRLPVIG